MSASDWREAARRIPVGRDDRIYIWCLDKWNADVVRITIKERGIFVAHRAGMGHAFPMSCAIPRLDHPSERAAYDRRLALVHGQSEFAHMDRRLFGINGAHVMVWVLGSVEFHEIDTDDPLLARALAWPADKRTV